VGGEFLQESSADEPAAQEEKQPHRYQIGGTFVAESNSASRADFSQAV